MLLAWAFLGTGCTATIDGELGTSPSAHGGSAGAPGGSSSGAPAGTSSAERVVSPVPLRRLNRLEYNRTVRDLLGVDLRPADAFPVDSAISGFDNVAEGLGLAPALFDLYFTAARDLTDAALDAKPVFTASVPPEAGAPTGYTVGTNAWALHGATWTASPNVPKTAKYKISIQLSGIFTGAAPPPSYEYLIDGQQLDAQVASGVPTKPALIERELSLTAGPHKVEVVPKNFSNIGVENTNNEVIVHAFSIESIEQSPPAAGPLVFVCDVSEADCPARIVGHFAERAYRRPLSAVETSELTSLYQKLEAAEGRNEALKLTLRAVLTSPKFLYRAVRRADVKSPALLNDYVIASRLSYFLWSTMPDAELFDAAKAGELSSPAGLTRAVERMLQSPRIDGLLDGFAEQWLGVRALRNAAPAPAVYGAFDESLRAAMAEESRLFFRDFLSNGLSVRQLSNPDFGYLNDRLATHYGLPLPGSTELTRVSLAGDDRRGILALGAWLTAQSEPEHTSPIRRGRWFLEQLACIPIAPPPADVVAVLPPDPTLTVRERLVRHRANPACAGCHNLLDPAGLSLEVYDGIGAYRSTENGKPIDGSGTLLGGKPFANVRELAQLMEQDATLTACVTQKLFIYGLGRQLQPPDEPFLASIVQAARNGEGTLPELIAAIAVDPSFRAPPSAPDFEVAP